MIRSLLIALLALIEFASCKPPKYKVCNCKAENEELKAYSEILNELVEQRFYYRYLGKDEERIFVDYVKAKKDSVEIEHATIRLQNEIFNDPSRFAILYLDTAVPHRLVWFKKHLPADTSQYDNSIREVAIEISADFKSVIDSVFEVQHKYRPEDFILCTSKMKMLLGTEADTASYLIGKVMLSKIAFNREKNRGLLYIEYRCGWLCGYHELLLIEKTPERWRIKKAVRLATF